MITEAQHAANRRNAAQSTGPRTEAGKRRVSRNAITHGLDCMDLLLPEEDGAALAQYRAAMIADHDPMGAEEQDLVERMVAAQWRYRRVLRAEKEVYANQRYRLGPNAWTGSCVIGDQQQERAFAYLDRKEASLTREYHRCSRRLEALQALRRQGLRLEVVEDAAPAPGNPRQEAHAAHDEPTPLTEPTGTMNVPREIDLTPSGETPIREIAEQSQAEPNVRMREAA